jgi:hypothetical protein
VGSTRSSRWTSSTLTSRQVLCTGSLTKASTRILMLPSCYSAKRTQQSGLQWKVTKHVLRHACPQNDPPLWGAGRAMQRARAEYTPSGPEHLTLRHARTRKMHRWYDGSFIGSFRGSEEGSSASDCSKHFQSLERVGAEMRCLDALPGTTVIRYQSSSVSVITWLAGQPPAGGWHEWSGRPAEAA